MDKIIKEADLPFSCQDVFNAIAALENFPTVFPSVRKINILSRTKDVADAELFFNIPPALEAFLGKTSQDMHITLKPDSEIRLDSTGGALKSINIRWTFNEVSPAKTHVKFEMSYETGMNFAVNGTVKIFINRNTADILTNLEGHIRKKLTPPSAN